jgi:hypothetical protein
MVDLDNLVVLAKEPREQGLAMAIERLDPDEAKRVLAEAVSSIARLRDYVSDEWW